MNAAEASRLTGLGYNTISYWTNKHYTFLKSTEETITLTIPSKINPMARPTKTNAEYFSHDAGMRNDPKIKAIRKKFPNGYGIYCMLIEVLTDAKDFTIELTELQLELLAGDFDFPDVDADSLREIIAYFVKIELLKQEENQIYSNGLKNRLQVVLDKRNASRDKFLSQKLKKDGVSVTETTQSIVKYSKVKYSKDNNSNYYPSTDDAEGEEVAEILIKKPEQVSKQNFEEKKEAAAEKSVYEPLDFPEDEYLTAWTALTKERFFELIQMQHEKDVEKIKIYFKTFYQEKWADKSLSKYPSTLDFFKNFYRWIPYRKSLDKNQSQTTQIATNGNTNLNNRQFTSKTSTADRNRAERDQLDAITNSILLRTEIN